MNETIEMNTAEQNEQVRGKPYTFRMLSAQDIFPMANIIKKIGLREFKTLLEGDGLESILSAFNGDRDEKSLEAVGLSVALEILDIILGNLSKCENDIFLLLSQTSNLSVEEVRNLGLADFAGMILDFVKKDEFKDFIKVVSKSFK